MTVYKLPFKFQSLNINPLIKFLTYNTTCKYKYILPIQYDILERHSKAYSVYSAP